LANAAMPIDAMALQQLELVKTEVTE